MVNGVVWYKVVTSKLADLASFPGLFSDFQCCKLKSGRGPGIRCYVILHHIDQKINGQKVTSKSLPLYAMYLLHKFMFLLSIGTITK